MISLSPYFPWLLCAVLYLFAGLHWLKLVMATDMSDASRDMLHDMQGEGPASKAWAARVVFLTLLLGWPAFMTYGYVAARLSRGGW